MSGSLDDRRVVRQIDVRVPVAVVFTAVSDPRNYGRWSPEATGAILASGPHLAVGDRFTGRSSVWFPWTGQCTVVAFDQDQRFSFEVRIAGVRVSRWTYETTPTPDGDTHVTETWDDLRTGVAGTVVKPLGLVAGRGASARKRNAITMAQTLSRMKADLESRGGS